MESPQADQSPAPVPVPGEQRTAAAATRLLLNLDVPDLQAAITFYSAALGLRLQRRLDDDVAELAGAGVVLYLLFKAPGSAAHPQGEKRRYARHWTPLHFDLVVDDLEAACARALAAGARRESGPVHWRGSSCISLCDPFGHGFCLIAFADGGYR